MESAPEYLILRHPAYRHGDEAIGVREDLLRAMHPPPPVMSSGSPVPVRIPTPITVWITTIATRSPSRIRRSPDVGWPGSLRWAIPSWRSSFSNATTRPVAPGPTLTLNLLLWAAVTLAVGTLVLGATGYGIRHVVHRHVVASGRPAEIDEWPMRHESFSVSVVLGCVVIILACVAVLRRVDVRLTLFSAAMVLGVLAGKPQAIVQTFLATLADFKFVVPICCAMGFAYVLKATGCDRHLVELLIRPIQRVRGLLIPGTVLLGFVVNIPVISQTSTAASIGPVLIPLLLAARVSRVTGGPRCSWGRRSAAS